jgi:hypothetical protein
MSSERRIDRRREVRATMLCLCFSDNVCTNRGVGLDSHDAFLFFML